MARIAHIGIPDLHLHRRCERLYEVELTDGTDIFAKRAAAKEAIDDKGQHEITDGYPRRPPGAIPKRQSLVCPEKYTEQTHGEPFAPQPARPVPDAGQPAAC